MRVNFILDDVTYLELKHLAVDAHITISAMIRTWIFKALELKKKREAKRNEEQPIA